MISPHKPQMKGNSGDEVHAGRPDAAHEEEVRKADKGGTLQDGGKEACMDIPDKDGSL